MISQAHPLLDTLDRAVLASACSLRTKDFVAIFSHKPHSMLLHHFCPSWLTGFHPDVEVLDQYPGFIFRWTERSYYRCLQTPIL